VRGRARKKGGWLWGIWRGREETFFKVRVLGLGINYLEIYIKRKKFFELI